MFVCCSMSSPTSRNMFTTFSGPSTITVGASTPIHPVQNFHEWMPLLSPLSNSLRCLKFARLHIPVKPEGNFVQSKLEQ